MPILNYGTKSNWSLVTSLSKGEIFIFRSFIYDAKSKFKYKDDKAFLKTLSPNMDYQKPNIYSFDSSLSTKDDPEYILKLMELIKTANELMLKSDKNFKNYKIDIMGTWEHGDIIIMKRNSTDSDLTELSRKATMKRFIDAKWIPDNIVMKNLGKIN